MKQDYLKKMIILSIIFLFFGTSILPSISRKESFDEITPIVSGQIIRKNTILERNSFSKTYDFDNQIYEFMKLSHMPSLSASIIKKDNIDWYEGYGYSDIKNEKIPSQDTVYMIGSISKTFTATAIMQLYEHGVISLDDNVSEYLPFDLKNPKYPHINITFNMLLAHRSSLSKAKLSFPIYFTFLGYTFDWFDEYVLPNGGIYDENVWTDVSPGGGFSYSDIGFGILGYIVENITNQSFNKYCKEHIFQPLDMKNTSFELGDFNYDSLAIPYFHLLGFYIPLPHINTGSVCNPAGGLRTTISDLSHYLIAYMNDGVYNNTRILKNETIKLMHSIQTETDFDKNLFYGLGWMVWNGTDNETYVGHSGGILGGRAEMWFRQSDKTGVIYFWNQYHYVKLMEKPIEARAQQKIDELLWEKANMM